MAKSSSRAGSPSSYGGSSSSGGAAGTTSAAIAARSDSSAGGTVTGYQDPTYVSYAQLSAASRQGVPLSQATYTPAAPTPQRQRQIQLAVETGGQRGQGAISQNEAKYQNFFQRGSENRTSKINQGLSTGRYSTVRTSQERFAVVDRGGNIIQAGFEGRPSNARRPILNEGFGRPTSEYAQPRTKAKEGSAEVFIPLGTQAKISESFVSFLKTEINRKGEFATIKIENGSPISSLKKSITPKGEELGPFPITKIENGTLVPSFSFTRPTSDRTEGAAIGIPPLSFGKYATKPVGSTAFLQLNTKEQGTVFIGELANIGPLGISEGSFIAGRGVLKSISTVGKKIVAAVSSRAEASEIGGISKLTYKNIFGKIVSEREVGFRGASITELSPTSERSLTKTRLSKVVDIGTGEDITPKGRRTTTTTAAKPITEDYGASVSENNRMRSGDFSRKLDERFTISRGIIETKKPRSSFIGSESLTKTTRPVEIPEPDFGNVRGRKGTPRESLKTRTATSDLQINREIVRSSPKTVETSPVTSQIRQAIRLTTLSEIGIVSMQRQKQIQKGATMGITQRPQAITPTFAPPETKLKPRTTIMPTPTFAPPVTKTTTRLIPTTFNPTPILNPPGTTEITGRPGPFGMPTPSFPTLFPGRNKASELGRQGRGYTPSFSSLFLGRKSGKTARRLSKQKILSGLELRPAF